MASYLQVENISKSYGPKVLFDNISFNVNEGDKMALIAPNGTGKSSLLSIIAGIDSSDSGGEIKFLKDISIAFLEQEPGFDPDKSVLEQVCSRVQESGHQDIWDLETSVKQVLGALKLDNIERKMSLLSGGEQKRVAIAAMMVTNADFYIMDEPTNHLDIEAIEYMEDYLKKSRCTLLMVTHDRYFLDRVCNQILELDGGRLYSYKGCYSDFLCKREERIANFRANTDKARNLLRRELEWIRSTPCARSGKAKYRIDAFYDLKERAEQKIEQKEMNINVQSARLGKKIINCRNLGLKFSDKNIVDSFTYNFAPGEKIGIVGGNGSGKSSFVNLLTGSLQPTSGSIDVGDTVRFGYYRQSGIDFSEDRTVFDVVHDIAEVVTLGDGSKASVTTFLQYFMFPPSMLNTRVERLSGGEKRRLYLLTVLMRNPNFLILDEPTNDLDILTLNVLEEYLKSYRGSVIVISHDRYFLDKIADHILIFQGEGRIKDFYGMYSEYHAQQSAIRKRSDNQPTVRKEVQRSETVRKKKLSFKEQREMEQIEKDLETLASEKSQLEQSLSEGNFPYEEISRMSVRIGEIIAELDEKELRWLELSESIA